MNNRFKELRTKLLKERGINLTQKDFADKFELSENYVWMIEKGTRTPADRTIRDICREFGVSEDWLRDGKGDPFISLSREAQITRFVGEAMKGETPTDQQRFLNALMGATPDELHAIANFAKRLAAEYAEEQKKKGDQ